MGNDEGKEVEAMRRTRIEAFEGALGAYMRLALSGKRRRVSVAESMQQGLLDSLRQIEEDYEHDGHQRAVIEDVRRAIMSPAEPHPSSGLPRVTHSLNLQTCALKRPPRIVPQPGGKPGKGGRQRRPPRGRHR